MHLRTAPLPALGLAWLALASLAACPAEEDCAPQPSEEGEEGAADEDVSYGGLGNDEVWLALYDAKARAETGGDAATPVVPSEGQVLPADTLPTFEWQSPLRLTFGPERPEPLWGPKARSPLDALTGWLLPSAWAHLPPVTSDAYLLEIGIPGRTCPRTVVTTGLLHTLDTATFDLMKEASGEELTLTIWSAYLTTGVITEGPFVTAPLSCRVA